MNEFLTIYEDCPDELKEGLVFVEACEIASERANLAVDTYTKMTDLEARAHEVRFASEGAGFDRLCSFYEEEENNSSQSTQKKKGLIQQAWDAIKKFFNSIKEKLFGAAADKKVSEIPDNATGEVPSKMDAAKAAAAAFLGKLKAFISDHKAATLIAALTAIGGSIAGVFVLRKKKAAATDKQAADEKEISGREMKKIYADNKSLLNELGKNISGLEKLEHEANEHPEKFADDFAESVVEAITASKELSFILGAFGMSAPAKETPAVIALVRGIVNKVLGFFQSIGQRALNFVVGGVKKVGTAAASHLPGGKKGAEEATGDQPDMNSWNENWEDELAELLGSY